MKKYNLGIQGYESKIKGGTNILLLGPPLTGKDILTKSFFYEGIKEKDSSAIYVTTTDSSKSVLDWFEENNLSLGDESNSYGIVDCVTESQELEKPENDSFIKYASSPVDLTDIGVKISNFLKDFYKNGENQKIRLIIDTVSVMIMYSDVKTIFRFLHTFSGRIKSVNGIGMYVLEAGSHEEKTIKTLKQLMDSSLETKDEDGSNKIRLQGRSLNFDWKSYEVCSSGINLVD